MSKKRVSSIRPPPAMRPLPSGGRPKNRLLAALPAEDFSRLFPHLKTVPIRLKQVLHKQGKQLKEVYFPNGGVVSITTFGAARSVEDRWRTWRAPANVSASPITTPGEHDRLSYESAWICQNPRCDDREVVSDVT